MACPVDKSYNLENQEDELLALCSIYDDRVFTRSNDEMEGQINVHLHLPDHFEVKIAPKRVQRQRSHSSDGLRHSGDEPTCGGLQEWEVFQVKYLPPIVLNFSLPPGYPSSEPPEFTLSCKWLTVMQLSKLCKIMDSQWDESPCDVILFRWIQFLQEDSVNVLELTSPLVLNSKMFTRQCTSRPGNSSSNHDRVARDCDPRAVQDVSSCSVLLDIILDYDQQEKERVFQTNHHSCGVCFCEKLGSACILFPKCDHVFCTECIAEYFKVQIENGSVKALMCPETECDSQALPSQVKNVVSPDLFAKYDKFLLQSSLNEMSDIVYCPRPTCQSPVILERDVTVGVCLVCRFAFCSLCKLTFHGVSPCKFRPDDIKKLKIEYENANPAEKLFLERRYGKNRIRRMIDEFNSEEWLLDNSKACPRCGTHIQKSEGCNKMTCSKCRTHFCWLCGKILNHQNPYGHFNAYNSSCFNRLFEGVEIDENEDDEEPFW